jgi:hypothetical protein
LMRELAKKQPENLHEFMEKAEEFINQEENLREIRLSRQEPISAHKETEKKKKKESEVQTITSPRAPTAVDKFNFTPLNTTATEVLWEIKKDPEYVRPAKILGEPLAKNRHKYCLYHEANGHTTEGCISLRFAIEKFISNGKLVKFLANQKDHQDQRREADQRPRQGPPRDNRPPRADRARTPPRYDRDRYGENRDRRERSRERNRDRREGSRDRERRQEEPRRERSRSRSPANRHVLGEIRTISGGFAGGGETQSARKSYARQAKHWEVYNVERPLKSRKAESLIIGFSDEDYAGVSRPHTDALVVSMRIGNHNVHRILVDNGSSADILYWSAFLHLGINRDKLVPATCPLIGFAGEQVYPVGSIELPVTPGEYPRQRTIMVKFLLVDKPSAYNVILGRAALNELEAVISTSHLKMKFPTKEGVGEVRGDQYTARQCYNTSLKDPVPRTVSGERIRREDK